MGTILTFYSFKGGVGRSMALANIAVLLSQWGYKVLAIDFDLEAPGLQCFFRSFLDLSTIKAKRGLVDFIGDQFAASPERSSWKSDLIPIRLPHSSGQLSLWTAGIQDQDYFKRVRSLDFPEFYAKMNGGSSIEALRTELKTNFDYVLVDSRTGLTDIGGVCTVQLPDTIVWLFTATDQSFEGGLDIVKRASSARQRLPFPRPLVPTIPVPSRFDSQGEYRLSQKWLDRFARDLQDIYSEWLPRTAKPRELLELIKLPHISYFSFGETLPVIEQGTTDPGGLGFAYENVSALIARGLQDIELLINKRDEYVTEAAKERPSRETRDSRARIFISYSHADSEWARLLEIHLRPLIKSRDLTVWDDTKIQTGSSWREEIVSAIEQADVAVLLVSPDYLASDFILDAELPTLLRAAEERGLRIIWVAIRPSLFDDTAIAQFQAANDPNAPLSELNSSQRDRAFVNIARRISESVGRAY